MTPFALVCGQAWHWVSSTVHWEGLRILPVPLFPKSLQPLGPYRLTGLCDNPEIVHSIGRLGLIKKFVLMNCA